MVQWFKTALQGAQVPLCRAAKKRIFFFKGTVLYKLKLCISGH